MIRAVAGVDAQQLDERLEQQAGADDEHERDGHLGGDEHAAEPAPARRAGAARRVLERRRQIGAGAVQGGHETEHEARRHGQQGREAQHARIDADRVEAGGGHGAGGDDGSYAPRGEEGAGGAARRGEDHRLGEHLAYEPGRARPERRAHGDFATASRRAREREVRHVGARDEQHEGDGAHEHEEGQAERSGHLLVQRHQHEALALVGRGVLRREPVREPVHRGAGRGERHLRSQPRHHLQDDQPPCRRCRVEPERPEDVRVRLHRRAEVRRQHANDGVGDAGQRQRASNDAGVAAEMPPERVRQENDRWGARSIVGGLEAPSERRRDTQHAEVVLADLGAREPLGFAVTAREARAPAGDGGGAREHVVLAAPVEEEGRRRPLPRGPVLEAQVLPDHDEAIGLRIGQRTQQHAVDDREDGRVGADAERERRDRDDGESRLAAKGPEGELQIGEHGLYFARAVPADVISNR